MDHKKSIVSYDDDEDDDQSANGSTKEYSKCSKLSQYSSHHKKTLKSCARKDSSNDKEKRSEKDLKHRFSIQDPRKEHREKDRHTSHRHHGHHSRSSTDRHRHYRGRSRSPTHKQRYRSRSRSHSRDSYHRDAYERSSTGSKHKSRNCHKSKRDRSRSRSKESKSDRRYEHKSNSPSRKGPFESARQSATQTNDLGCKKEPLEIQADLSANAETKDIVLMVAEPKLPTLPKLYNPNVVKPIKLATKEEKRKLLWGDTKKDTTSSNSSKVWANLQFQGEHGTEMTMRFRKLMGIKSNGNEPSCDTAAAATEHSDISTSQEKLFQNLDMQYSAARMSTHTHRGVGLGFATNNRLL